MIPLNLLFILTVIFLPDSPYYFIKKNQDNVSVFHWYIGILPLNIQFQEAERSLRFYRNALSTKEEIQSELADIKVNSNKKEETSKMSYKDFREFSCRL